MRQCDVTFDKTVMYKDKVKKGSETRKQSGVEVGLLKSLPSHVATRSQETLETVVEEQEAEPVTLDQALKRSSRTIRAPDMYST